jgi:hypothetical protein
MLTRLAALAGATAIAAGTPPGVSAGPVAAQVSSSGGCWRTLQRLADFAIAQTYLSTAAKWGISKLDALRSLFNGNAWLLPTLEPSR